MVSKPKKKFCGLFGVTIWLEMKRKTTLCDFQIINYVRNDNELEMK